MTQAGSAIKPSSPAAARKLFLAQDKILVEAITKLAQAVSQVEATHAFAPVTPLAVIVGGYVRDLLLGATPKDADVEVYGVHPDLLHKLVQELFGQVEIVGQAFGVLKVFLSDGYELDVAVPRRESVAGKGHKGFKIDSDPSLSFREAAKRRDFTINALALDPLSGVIHDPFDGLKDLEHKALRIVDETTFQEDPLRVLRGVQLSARLRFPLEQKTFDLMFAMVGRGDLELLSQERITDEWKKLLVKSERPSLGMFLLRNLGIIEKYFPEIHVLKDTPQEPAWHPEGNVWIHTLMVMDQAAKLARQPERNLSEADRLTVLLGALCHDLGKATTTGEIQGRIRSHGHEEAGEAPTRQFFQKFNFGNDLEDQAVRITKDHLKTTRYWMMLEKGEVTEEQYANILRRLLRRLDSVSVEIYLAVTEADKRGRGLPNAQTEPYTEGEVFRSTLKKFDLLTQAKTPLLKGGELIEKFSLTPGPQVGELLKAVENARDEGEVKTHDEALSLVEKLLKV